MRISISCLLAIWLLGVSSSEAEDWPQWLGKNRASDWRENGIVERFPKDGPTVKWRIPVQWGYAGPAVADDKVYLMDYVHQSGKVTNSAGTRDKLSGMERILCFDANDGQLIWAEEYNRPYSLSYPRGPRCTPTVADGKVYALGAEGDLTCLDANSGHVVWRKNLPEVYRCKIPIWGFSTHPLVDNDLVYCIVGGQGQSVVALDKNTGKERWRALSTAESGYCPPTMIERNGMKQLIIWDRDSINSLDPVTGEVVWSTELKPKFGMATAAPRLVGDHIFATGAGRVSALITASTGDFVWRGTPKTSVGCSMSTPVISDGIIYGNDAESGTLMAARVADGEQLWQTVQPIDPDNSRGRGPRNANLFIVKNGAQYFLFNESGELILAKLSPDGYEEISRATILKPTNHTGARKVVWSHPAFANKCMFARNDEELVCVSLAADSR
jgi:outer membrane protein assembly factor BamB